MKKMPKKTGKPKRTYGARRCGATCRKLEEVKRALTKEAELRSQDAFAFGLRIGALQEDIKTLALSLAQMLKLAENMYMANHEGTHQGFSDFDYVPKALELVDAHGVRGTILSKVPVYPTNPK